jgi:hypothetical protein
MKYFKQFPKIEYDLEKDNIIENVTDIFRRVIVRENLDGYVNNFSKINLNAEERPEMAAHGIYGNVDLNWVLMFMNKTIDPYHDWVMDQVTFENYVNKKYPNKYILLDENHYTVGDYGNSTGDSGERTFIEGETIEGYNSGGGGTTGDLGKIVKFDSTVRQLVYSTVSGIVGGTDYIKGQDSGAVGRRILSGDEKDAVHHYESSAPLEKTKDKNKVDFEQKSFWVNRGYSVVYSGTTYNATVITNIGHEESLNEDRRTIKMLSSNFLSQFTAEFQDKISK